MYEAPLEPLFDQESGNESVVALLPCITNVNIGYPEITKNQDLVKLAIGTISLEVDLEPYGIRLLTPLQLEVKLFRMRGAIEEEATHFFKHYKQRTIKKITILGRVSFELQFKNKFTNRKHLYGSKEKFLYTFGVDLRHPTEILAVSNFRYPPEHKMMIRFFARSEDARGYKTRRTVNRALPLAQEDPVEKELIKEVSELKDGYIQLKDGYIQLKKQVECLQSLLGKRKRSTD